MTTRNDLKNEINSGLEERAALIKNPTLTLCTKLENIAKNIKKIAGALSHDHGKLVGEELSIRSEYERMVLEEDADASDALIKRVQIAVKQAEFLGDEALILRLYQTRADYYALIGDIILEIDTVERGVIIKRDQERVERLVNLYKEYIQMLNSIVPKEKEEKIITDQTLEVNFKCFLEFKKLRNDDSFDYTSYVKNNHSFVFRVYIYVGVMLSNPFAHGVESKEQKFASEAFELSIEAAMLCGNTEYLCAAWGQKVGAYYGRANARQKEEWVILLKSLLARYKPKGEWIQQTLDDIENNGNIKLRNSDLGIEEDSFNNDYDKNTKCHINSDDDPNESKSNGQSNKNSNEKAQKNEQNND